MRRGRRWAITAAALAVAAVVIVVVVVLTTGGGSSLRNITARPSAYQITYRVQSTASGNGTTSWEVLTVRRPFDSSDVTYPTDPAAGNAAPTGATWFDVDGLYTIDGSGAVRKVAGRQPGTSGSDQALGVELHDLGARHLAKATGTTLTVAARKCRVVRFVEPPVGAIKPLHGNDHDDLCIDDKGLVLSERWTLSGKLAFVRTATRVELRDLPDPVSKTGATPVPGATAAPTATQGTDPSAPVKTPPTPAGYHLARADVFTLPPPSGSGVLAQSTIWAYTAGPDVITVEAGVEQGGHYPWDDQPTTTKPLTLRGLGPATTALRSDGPEIRVGFGNGRWVRIRGTVPLPQLISYAQALSKSP
jgi:hypothetical protein